MKEKCNITKNLIDFFNVEIKVLYSFCTNVKS